MNCRFLGSRIFLVTLPTVALMAAPAFAGYVVTTGSDRVNTPVGPMSGPQVGDTFATPPGQAGTFATYTPDTPFDPQLTGADLAKYRYTLTGAVTAVNLPLGQVNYGGTYDIFYDLNGDGSMDGGDPSVSAGNFAILAQFLPATNNATLTGTLTQTSGPTNPAFADLSYGGNPVQYSGFYTGDQPNVSGLIQGALTQTAPAPEPASLGILAIGGAGLLARRRRRGV